MRRPIKRIQPGVVFSEVSWTARMENLRCLIPRIPVTAFLTKVGGRCMHSSDIPSTLRFCSGVTFFACVRLYIASKMARNATGPHDLPEPVMWAMSCGAPENPHDGTSMDIDMRFGKVVRCLTCSSWRSLDNSKLRWSSQCAMFIIAGSLLERIISGSSRPDGSAARRKYSS